MSAILCIFRGQAGRTLFTLLLQATILWTFSAHFSQLSAAEKRKIPDDLELQLAEAKVKADFARGYKTRDRSELLTLSRQLHQKAGQFRDNPALEFVYLRESIQFAAKAGNAKLAFTFIKDFAQRYDVDAFKLKKAALQTTGTKLTKREEFEQLSRITLELLVETLAREDFEESNELIKKAQTYYKKSKSKALKSILTKISRDLKSISKAREKLDFTLKRLPEDSTRGEANLLRAEYYCGFLGDWDKGLDFFSRGQDLKLLDLAKKDLEMPSSEFDQLALGKSWNEKAQSMSGLPRSWYTERAIYWYIRALEKFRGIERTRIVTEIKQLNNHFEKPMVNLLPASPIGVVVALADKKKFDSWTVKDGKWTPTKSGVIAASSREDIHLVSKLPGKWSHLSFEFKGGNPGLYFTSSRNESSQSQGVNLDEDGDNNGEINRSIDNRKWNTIRLERTETGNNYYLNEELVHTSSRFDNPVHIRLKSQRGTTQFRNFFAIGVNTENG